MDRYFKWIQTENAIKALHEHVLLEDLEDHVELLWRSCSFDRPSTACLAIPQIPGGHSLELSMPAEQMDYV